MTNEELVIKTAKELGLRADIRKHLGQKRYTVYFDVSSSERLKFDGFPKAMIFLSGVRIGKKIHESRS